MYVVVPLPHSISFPAAPFACCLLAESQGWRQHASSPCCFLSGPGPWRRGSGMASASCFGVVLSMEVEDRWRAARQRLAYWGIPHLYPSIMIDWMGYDLRCRFVFLIAIFPRFVRSSCGRSPDAHQRYFLRLSGRTGVVAGVGVVTGLKDASRVWSSLSSMRAAGRATASLGGRTWLYWSQ